jgi:Tfp pilus assembly protein PilF
MCRALHSLSVHAFADARLTLEASLAEQPWSEVSWLLLAHTEVLSGSIDAARERLAAMRREVGTAESWLVSADLELYAADVPSSLVLLKAAVDAFPSEPALWLLIGSVWERRGQLSEAREAYARAVAVDCREPDTESLGAALVRVDARRGASWLDS